MGGRAARHDRPSPLPEHPPTHRVGDQEPSAMTDAATRRRWFFSPAARRSNRPRIASRASFPGGNGFIALAAISPVAASEVTALSTVERRIVRKDIMRW